MQPDAIADVVVMTVKAALAPVLERLAVAEARLSAMPGVDQAVTELRERIVAAETKAAAVQPAPEVIGSELRAQIASGNLLVAIERAERVVADLTKDVGTLRERVVIAETKAATVQPAPVSDADGLRDRLAVLEGKSLNFAETLGTFADLSKSFGELRERVAVVEVRGQVPGPPGKDGSDGVDGLGWGDLTVTQGDDERTFMFQGVRDGQVKSFGSFVVPVEIYRGVWLEGKSYDRGDGVTWGGSEWHCNESTSMKPGDGKAWTLKVKKGRDGKDGRDAVTLPVVSVGSSRG